MLVQLVLVFGLNLVVSVSFSNFGCQMCAGYLSFVLAASVVKMDLRKLLSVDLRI